MAELSEIKAGQRVLAVTPQDGRFRSIELRKRARFLECLSCTEGQPQEDLFSFAQKVGVLDASGRRVYHGHEQVVLGLSSVGVSFYRMTLPKVSPEETEAMVRMQVDTRLPLPIDEMEIDWKTISTEQQQCTVAVVAARRATLLPTENELKRLEPHAFFLEADAIVEAWKWIFTGDGKDGIILSCNAHHTVVCSARNGRLIQAAVLDIGVDDVARSLSNTGGELQEGYLDLDQFIQDLEGLLLLFDADLSRSSGVVLLSDGSDTLHQLAQRFIAAGLDVTEAVPDKEVFTGRHYLESQDIYDYRVAIGLALCELDTSGRCFTLLKDVCGRPDQRRTAWLTPWRTGLAAAVAVVVMAGVLYGIDVMRYQALSRLTETAAVKQFQQEKAYQKVVARHRPDLLELMDEIACRDIEGIILDTFHFQKGQPVKITGRADKPEQWYEFEKTLTQLKGISQLRPDQLVKDEKDNNKVKFGVSFHYKTFTQRASR